MLKLTLIVIFSAVLVSCNRNNYNQPNPAPANMKSSFSLVQAKDQANAKDPSQIKEISFNNNLIILSKKSLNKTFLLSPTLINSSNMPILDHLSPKVVIFIKNGDKLALVEQNFQSLYENLPSDKLIQTFTIDSEDEESISFQWKYSLDSMPTGGFVVSDAPETAVEKFRNESEKVTPQIKNFVEKIALDQNALIIQELVRLKRGNESESTAKIYYEFKPYKANENFQIRKSKLYEGIGYFETFRANLFDQEPEFLASRWDISNDKKIIYAITKGVPAELLESVKEGILYWNIVFGKEVIQVETNVDPDEIPTNARVIIHWIPWKSAGFARASMQMDPISGEILKANVYLTSAFAVSTGNLIRSIDFKNRVAEQNVSFAPNHFKISDHCQFPMQDNVSLIKDNIQSSSSVDSKLLTQKAMQDRIRYVTAHEVGHTLGLRHNFAASFDAEVSKKEEVEDNIAKYLSDLTYMGAKLSTTVMDYVFNLEGLVVGANIKAHSLSYDKTAIEWGYSAIEKEVSALNPSLFCTDVERIVKAPYGCQVGDIGNNPIYHSVNRQNMNHKNLMKALFLNKILNPIAPTDARNKISFENILLQLKQTDLSELAKISIAEFNATLNFLDSKTPVLFKDLNYRHGSNWSNSEELKGLAAKKIKEDLSTVNGFLGLLESAYPFSDDSEPVRGWLEKQVEVLFAHPEIKKGVNSLGVNYELTQNQIEQLKPIFLTLAKKLEDKILLETLKSFAVDAKSEGFRENIGIEIVDDFVTDLVKNIVFVTDGMEEANFENLTISVPKYRFEEETRAEALKLLSTKRFNIHAWQKKAVKSIKDSILEKIKEKTNETVATAYDISQLTKTKKLDKKTFQWLKQEHRVISAIDAIENENNLVVK